MVMIISLLRGINVGGNKKIKMEDLRNLYSSLGFQNTKTLLQSGNAVFETDNEDMSNITTTIETAIQERFGFDVTIILRTSSEFKEIVKRHPFSDKQLDAPSKIAIVYLSDSPDDNAIQDLKDNNPGNEEIHHTNGRELYIFYADGKGRSKLDNSRIERKLKVSATARNWNTTNKLLNIIHEFESS